MMLLDVKFRFLVRDKDFLENGQWMAQKETVLQVQKTFSWNRGEWEETKEWEDVPTEQE